MIGSKLRLSFKHLINNLYIRGVHKRGLEEIHIYTTIQSRTISVCQSKGIDLAKPLNEPIRLCFTGTKTYGSVVVFSYFWGRTTVFQKINIGKGDQLVFSIIGDVHNIKSEIYE